MTAIKITSGEYAGLTFTTYDMSIDERYIQVWIGRDRVEFKLGFNCQFVF
jgi:hypothetical protein